MERDSKWETSRKKEWLKPRRGILGSLKKFRYGKERIKWSLLVGPFWCLASLSAPTEENEINDNNEKDAFLPQFNYSLIVIMFYEIFQHETALCVCMAARRMEVLQIATRRY